ncbi:Carbamoyl-phosphate synthase small chain, chloroplastic [Glycine max]|nr:Carbamoyl-phosphate synthase small chain, chloroplastic [Glycine max]
MIVVHALFMMQCSMEIGLSVWIWASEWFFRHICNVVSVRASMATKALSFALSLNDLTNKHFSSNTPHTATKVSVFTVQCSSSGGGERPWKNSNARLVLEDGSIWKAKSFGASGTQVGEVFFNTSLIG